jgi:hypothetical protein
MKWLIPWVKWVFSFRIKKRPKPRVKTWAETMADAKAERAKLLGTTAVGQWDRTSALQALEDAGIIAPSGHIKVKESLDKKA